ncbi:MAG: hypothetical protein JWN14_2356 [Chthonomonadales bacterium]|nr:hypothetical protein [Chthonomonadales bacterium]
MTLKWLLLMRLVCAFGSPVHADVHPNEETGYVRLGTPTNGLRLALHRWGDFDHPHGGRIHLTWTMAGKTHDQELDMPPRWQPITSSPAYTVHAWPQRNVTTLEIMLHDPNSGTSDSCAPVFYHRVGTHWKLTNRNLDSFEFSTYGGLHLAPDHKKLYVWDLVGGGGSHGEPAHVWLQTWAWHNGSFHVISTRRTRQTYTFMDNGIKGKSISSKRDPLREFGRHWTWWQYE